MIILANKGSSQGFYHIEVVKHKYNYLQNNATKCNLATIILKVLEKPFKSPLLNVFNFKFRFSAYFWVRPAFDRTMLRLSSWEK